MRNSFLDTILGVRECDYPDWDGDESIMYYLKHYKESEEYKDGEL